MGTQKDQSRHPATRETVAGAAGWWLAALISLLVVLYFEAQVPPYPASDSGQYQAMALGQQVARPFANRILAPWLVHFSMRRLHLSLNGGFLLLGSCSLFALLTMLLGLVLSAQRGLALRVALAVGILATPLVRVWWFDLYLPDLLHAALLTGYLLLLRARQWTLAALVLPLLFLARESTSLLAFVALIIFAARWSHAGGRRVVLTHAAAVLIGLWLSARAGATGLPNVRDLGSGLYLLGKVPFNLAKSLFGMELWAGQSDGPAPPVVWQLPHALSFGNVHTLGWAGWSPLLVLMMLLTTLLIFGGAAALLPALWHRRHSLAQQLQRAPWLLLACSYGLLSWLVSPAVGTGFDRLAGYAFPLFLVGIPALLLNADVHLSLSRLAAGSLLLLHLAMCELWPFATVPLRLQRSLGLWWVPALLCAALLLAVCMLRVARSADVAATQWTGPSQRSS